MQRRTPNLLEPKRSVLAGLVKFLAVGCGLNEFFPSANIESSVLAESISVYLTTQAYSWYSPGGLKSNSRISAGDPLPLRLCAFAFISSSSKDLYGRSTTPRISTGDPLRG